MNRRRTTILAAAALLVLGMTPTSATADSGPRNGQLVFDRGPAGEDPSMIFIANPDGTAERRLTPTYVEGCCARWSPDGEHLAHPAFDARTGQAGTGLYDSGGTGFHLLPNPGPGIISVCSVWSPRQTRLACVLYRTDNETSPGGVFTVRANDGSDLTRATTNPYPDGTDDPMAYSPDGSQILFRRDEVHDGPAALFVTTRAGSVHRITPWGMVRNGASWSPDGNWILFNDHKGRLWTVHPNGTGLHKIKLDVATDYFAFEADWSPDGTRMAFSMWVPDLGQDDIYTANPDGTDVRQVTNTPEHEGNVDWGTHRRQ